MKTWSAAANHASSPSSFQNSIRPWTCSKSWQCETQWKVRWNEGIVKRLKKEKVEPKHGMKWRIVVGCSDWNDVNQETTMNTRWGAPPHQAHLLSSIYTFVLVILAGRGQGAMVKCYESMIVYGRIGTFRYFYSPCLQKLLFYSPCLQKQFCMYATTA